MRTIALAVILAAACFAATRNVTCSGTITAALQAAVDASVDGDIVNITSGSCSSGNIDWTNKNITVQGQGIGVTTVSGLSFTVTDTTKAAFRITGMSVGAPGYWKLDANNRTTGIQGWRIDHIAFSYPSCGQNIAIWIYGINWGLIDHNTFTNAGNAVFLSGYAEGTDEVSPWPPDGAPGMGGYSWLLPLDLGTDKAVYIEDNTFTLAGGCYYGIGDSFYGGRSVFRHNTVTNAYWQNHAARGWERGGNAKAEIYNNDFNATDSAWQRAVHIRSGTGVVFNNTLRGYFVAMNVDNQRSDGQNTDTPFGACNGSSAWDGNTSGQSGWPCLDQIGRSPGTSYPNQASVPLYVWNNGSSTGCASGGTCNNSVAMTSDGDAHVVDGRDYINNGTTAKPGYTPYTYPHPLQGSAGVAPIITTSSPLPDGTVGVAYSQQLTASGDTPTWAVTSGALPAGLSLSSGGAITGTPTTAQTVTPTVTATNASGTDPKVLSITITAAPSGQPNKVKGSWKMRGGTIK